MALPDGHAGIRSGSKKYGPRKPTIEVQHTHPDVEAADESAQGRSRAMKIYAQSTQLAYGRTKAVQCLRACVTARAACPRWASPGACHIHPHGA